MLVRRPSRGKSTRQRSGREIPVDPAWRAPGEPVTGDVGSGHQGLNRDEVDAGVERPAHWEAEVERPGRESAGPPGIWVPRPQETRPSRGQREHGPAESRHPGRGDLGPTESWDPAQPKQTMGMSLRSS